MGDLTANEFGTVVAVFRAVFGFVVALHGWGKIRGGIEGTANWFESIGMRPGRLHALAAAGAEIGTGLLLALGLLTPFAAAGIVALMLVAGWTVHRDNGFMIVGDGWEYTFVVAFVAVFVAALGPGDFSIDEAIGLADTWNGWTGLVIAVGLGVVAGVGHLVAFYRPPEADNAVSGG